MEIAFRCQLEKLDKVNSSESSTNLEAHLVDSVIVSNITDKDGATANVHSFLEENSQVDESCSPCLPKLRECCSLSPSTEKERLIHARRAWKKASGVLRPGLLISRLIDY